jgi:hypothetical protein
MDLCTKHHFLKLVCDNFIFFSELINDIDEIDDTEIDNITHLITNKSGLNMIKLTKLLNGDLDIFKNPLMYTNINIFRKVFLKLWEFLHNYDFIKKNELREKIIIDVIYENNFCDVFKFQINNLDFYNEFIKNTCLDNNLIFLKKNNFYFEKSKHNTYHRNIFHCIENNHLLCLKHAYKYNKKEIFDCIGLDKLAIEKGKFDCYIYLTEIKYCKFDIDIFDTLYFTYALKEK